MQPKYHRAISPEIAGKLGQISDRELAKLSGLSPYFIKQARLAKGIEAVRRGYDLPDELVQQLGKVPDAQLTDRYGVPGPVLCRARQDRSIPRFRILQAPDSIEYVAFSDEAIALLGKIPDVELAKRFDRSWREVKQERNIRGIESYTKGRNLPCELVQQLGLVPDSVLVSRYSVAACTIKRARESRSISRFRSCNSPKANQGSALGGRDPVYQPPTQPRNGLLKSDPELIGATVSNPATTSNDAVWTPHVLTQLGKVKDIEIARLAGVSPSTVGLKRKALGIQPVLKGGWTQELLSLLGKVPDKELAEQSCGALTENSVCKARLHRRIPACVAVKLPSKTESAEVRALLGVVNDYEISRRTGVARSDIARLRFKLRIDPAKSGRLPRRKSKILASLPPKNPEFGIESEPKGCDKAWSEEEEALLGTTADSKVAELLKVDFWTVYYRRKAMNIPAFEFAYS